MFIRDCFDRFFDLLSPIERYLEINLISLKDVGLVLEYQVQAMARNRNIFEDYLDAYGFRTAKKLFERFPIWNNKNV